MPRYIDADEITAGLQKALKGRLSDNAFKLCVLAYGLVNHIPTADVAPVKRGTWKPCGVMLAPECDTVKCSECGYMMATERGMSGSPYCPHCGAKMSAAKGGIRMTQAIIMGAGAFVTVVAALTYAFRVRPALDEREIRREMSVSNASRDTSPA